MILTYHCGHCGSRSEVVWNDGDIMHEVHCDRQDCGRYNRLTMGSKSLQVAPIFQLKPTPPAQGRGGPVRVSKPSLDNVPSLADAIEQELPSLIAETIARQHAAAESAFEEWYLARGIHHTNCTHAIPHRSSEREILKDVFIDAWIMGNNDDHLK